MIQNFRKRILISALSVALISQPALANTSTSAAAAAAGLIGLIGGLIIGASKQASPPPPQYVPHVRVYTLEEKANMGDVNAQLKLAQNYETGAGVTHNDAQAYKWYLKAANTRNSYAELKIARMLADGIGTERNENQALLYYQLSASHGNAEAFRALLTYANQGNSYAEIGLGYLYQNGLGVPVNNYIAANWYRQAAEQGNSEAQNSIGIMYENGNGVPRNYLTALRWYKYGALQGNANAEANLGRMYSAGRGASIDRVEAYKWFALSAAQKNTVASGALISLEPLLSPGEVEEGQAKARDFVVRPPYSKDEMDYLNKLDDIRIFVGEHLMLLVAAFLLLGTLLTRKYMLSQSARNSKGRQLLTRMMRKANAFADQFFGSIKQKMVQMHKPYAGKNIFQILEVQFMGPNRFRSFVTLVVCIFLILSNPNERDFNSYFRTHIEQYSDGNKLAEAFASTIVNNITERHSYILFSVFEFTSPFLATFNENIENRKFLGIGGTIIAL